MTQSPRDTDKPRPAFNLRGLLTVHRRIGVISAVFVVLLSLSGLVLHHATRLNLDDQFIDSSMLLSWYAIEVPPVTRTFAVGSDHISQIAEAVYFGTTRLPVGLGQLVGAVATDFGVIVAGRNQLLLLTAEGDIVEALGSQHGVPPAITAIGRDATGRLYLQGIESILLVDIDQLQFTAADPAPDGIRWSVAMTSNPLAEEVRAEYGRSLLTWERLVLDIHSGRFLGSFGVVLVDIMALLFVFMAATGIWIWSRRRIRP